MHQADTEKGFSATTYWILALVCVAVVVFSLCGGAAFAGISQARYAAARAGTGQIEAVLHLAEEQAEKNGLGPRPATFTDLLKSYDLSYDEARTPYERYVLERMLDSFGPARSFDFAITRFEDAQGIHTQIYFFPTRGRTDLRADHYYHLSGGVLYEENG